MSGRASSSSSQENFSEAIFQVLRWKVCLAVERDGRTHLQNHSTTKLLEQASAGVFCFRAPDRIQTIMPEKIHHCHRRGTGWISVGSYAG